MLDQIIEFLKKILRLGNKKTVGVPVPKPPKPEVPLPDEKPQGNDGDPKWLQIAKQELGQKEIPGDHDNPRILEYLSVVVQDAFHDEIPWCAAFVNWCLKSAGKPGTGSGLARSFMHYGSPVAKEDLRPGDILVFERDGAMSWKGHVAFYVGHGPWVYHCLGGNQADSVSIRSYSANRLLAARRPV